MKCCKSQRGKAEEWLWCSSGTLRSLRGKAEYIRSASASWPWTHANGLPTENGHMYKGPGHRSDSPQHNHDRCRTSVPTPELPVSHSPSHCLRSKTGTLINPLTHKNVKLKRHLRSHMKTQTAWAAF